MQFKRLRGRNRDKKGIEKLLTEQVMKKIEKGKTIPEIADALEEDEETIRRIVETLSQKHFT